MAVRNFYVNGDIDGRQTWLTGGPVHKDGGMTLRITQRDQGSIVTAFSIKSIALNDGKLLTRVFDANGNTVGELMTDR